MKKIVLAAVLFFGGWLIARAQTVAPFQFSVTPSSGPSGCAIVPAQTTYCFAGDGGIYVSVNGASFVTPKTGVVSLTVCNAAGASCSQPQSGAVSVNIPTKASTTSTTALQ